MMREVDELKNMITIIQGLKTKVESIDESVGSRDLQIRAKMNKLKGDNEVLEKKISRNKSEIKELYSRLSKSAKQEFDSEFKDLVSEEKIIEPKDKVVRRTVSGLPPVRKEVEDYPIRKDNTAIAPALQSESVKRALGINAPIQNPAKPIYQQKQEINVEEQSVISEQQTKTYREPIEYHGEEGPNSTSNKVVSSKFNNVRAFNL